MIQDASMLRFEPASADPNDLTSSMLEFCEEAGIEPYAEQLDAFDAICSDESVVLNTPTGSGKSLVALCAHFACYWRGWRRMDPQFQEHERRSVYTAPIKALVNEKFIDLCGRFGADNVGLMTGDATVNRDAPIICCTAEILAKWALQDGARTPFGWVVMDEFHFYSDPQRGTAWLIPLVEMTDSRFLLMSATLSDPEAVRHSIERRTDAAARLVRSTERPVPLEFEYRENLLLETIQHVRENDLTPTYVVSFTKRDAATLAADLKRTPIEDAALKAAVKANRAKVEELLERHRLDSPFGKKLAGLLPAGIGIHHSGLLPKYRRLVEKLAAKGLVSLICGTDTLGVGVNMPIRSVVFRQLYKFDGVRSRTLQAREFAQIAGRAGRRGHDTTGTVLVQAPEHEVQNAIDKAKAQAKGKKHRPSSPPKGFKGWSEKTLEKIRDAPAEPLVTRFEVTGSLVLQMLHRSGDGWADLQRLIDDVGFPGETKLDELRERARERAGAILDAYLERGIVERVEGPDGGERYRVSDDHELASSFERPMAPFLAYLVTEGLDREASTFDLDVVSAIEAVVDDPPVVLRRQAYKLRKALRDQAFSRDQSLAERQAMDEELEEIQHPQPLAEPIFECFERWRQKYPYIVDEEPRPKSVVREMFERGDSFTEYVRYHDLVNDEGGLLRHLSEVFTLLARIVRPAIEDERVDRLAEDLEAIIERVDTSLVDEWRRYQHPDGPLEVVEPEPLEDPGPPDITRATGLFRRMVRNKAFGWIGALAAGQYEDLASPALSASTIAGRMDEFAASRGDVGTGPDARGPSLFEFDPETGRVVQRILDPEDLRDWRVVGHVDLDRSRDEGAAVVEVVDVGPDEVGEA